MGMTREETKSCIGTIEMLQRLAYNIHGVMDVIDADNCKKIIKALEQEPCEDAISRQAINELQKYRYNCGDTTITCVLLASINELPSVTHKTGHWIKIKPYPLQMHDYECSECGHETDDNTENYCSECGAKMEVSKYEC